MKIAVIGDCQCVGVAHALCAILPNATVRPLLLSEVNQHVSGDLDECKVIFYNKFAPGFFSETEIKSRSNCFYFPSIAFFGFQPDCIYIHAGEQACPSPVGVYHSAIAAASFSLGLGVERTLELFNSFVFARLGYFDALQQSIQYWVNTYTSEGYDLTSDLASWLSSGAFMYAPNHPKIHVLAKVAWLAAQKATLASAETAIPDVPFDWLAGDTIWPVYPEIAARTGVLGSHLFKARNRYKEDTLISLEKMVRLSFELYRQAPIECFHIPAVAKIRDGLQSILARTTT